MASAGRTMDLRFNIAAAGQAAVSNTFASMSKQLDTISDKQKELATAAAKGGKAMEVAASPLKDAWIGVAAQNRKVIASAKQCEKAWIKAGKSFGRFGREVKRTMFAIVAATAAASGAVYAFAAKTAAADRATGQNAQKVGMMVEQYSRLQYAFNTAGASEEAFQAGAKNLSKVMEAASKGNKEAQLAFLNAGVAYKDAEGKLKGTDEVMLSLAASFSQMPDGAHKTALAMKILGRSGTDMIPALNKGADALLQQTEFAKRWGLDVSAANVAAADEFHESQNMLRGMVQGVATAIGHELMPAVNDVMRAIIAWAETSEDGVTKLEKVKKWAKKFADYIPKLVEHVKTAGRAIEAAAIIIDNLIQRFGGWESAIERVVYAWLGFKALKLGVLFFKFAYDLGLAIKATANFAWSIVKAIYRILLFSAVLTAKAAVAVAKFAWSILKTAIPAVARFSATLITRAIPAIASFVWSMAVGAASAIASFAAASGGAIIGALSALAAGIGAAATAAWGFTAALLANPVTWIVIGIVALIAALYLLWKHWDTVSAWLKAAWNAVSDAVAPACDWIVAKWDAACDWVSEKWNWLKGKATGFASSMWNEVKAYFNTSIDEVKAAFDAGFVDGLLKILEKFNPLDLVTNAINAVSKYLFGVDLKVEGMALVNKLIDGLKQYTPLDAIVKAMTDIIDYIKDLGKRLYELGEELIMSIVDGILDAWSKVKDTVGNTIKSIPGYETASKVAGGVNGAASGATDWLTSVGLNPFAEGGVVTRPTPAIVGEAGPEVIIPVTRRGRAMDLMSTAADMMGLGNAGGAGGDIQITYAPKISVTGGGDAENIRRAVADALARGKDDFERMIENVMRKQKRLAMA